jgi:alpha-mannosidase
VYHIVPDRATRLSGTLLDSPLVLGDASFRVAAQEDGTLYLQSGTGDETLAFFDLLRFEDRGDVGDGWTYRAPERDEAVYSGAAKVSVLCDGPLYAALRLETAMSVPRSASGDRRGRSGERVDMPITSTIAILKGDPALHVETVVDNPARDHKLRVLFPSDREADAWFSDSPFDLTERPIKVLETADWDEPALEIWWQQSVCGVNDGDGGLAIIAPECKESACIDDGTRTLALSLFRAFGQTVGTAGEDGPQMLGRNVFRYQVVPFAGAPAEAGLLNRAAAMRAGLRAVILPPHEGDQPKSFGLVDLAPAWLPLSTVKKREAGAEAGDEIIVRFFNPSPEAVEATLTFPMGIVSACRANLLEEPGEGLAVEDGTRVRLAVRGKEIVTVAVRHH